MLDMASLIERMLKGTPGSLQVVNGSASTWGVRDHSDTVIDADSGAPVTVDAEVIRVATGKIGTLAVDGTITVSGASRTVGEHRRVDDGLVTLIVLS